MHLFSWAKLGAAAPLALGGVELLERAGHRGLDAHVDVALVRQPKIALEESSAKAALFGDTCMFGQVRWLAN